MLSQSQSGLKCVLSFSCFCPFLQNLESLKGTVGRLQAVAHPKHTVLINVSLLAKETRTPNLKVDPFVL